MVNNDIFARFENLRDYIYQSLLPYSHSIRKDVSRPHFPDPVFFDLLVRSLAIAFIIAPWSALWKHVWQSVLKRGDSTPAIILQIRQEVESNPRKGHALTKKDVLEAIRTSLSTYSTISADEIEIITKDIAQYIMRLYQEQ